jgi:hypothetical protein
MAIVQLEGLGKLKKIQRLQFIWVVMMCNLQIGSNISQELAVSVFRTEDGDSRFL